jgi:type VI secretion system protein ImpG
MDPRLLRLYSDELTHLRERGAEFAREFPRIAARLSMDGIEVTDPYVERLLEGFAFLTARIQLKLDAEYPRLVQHLLEATYPNFLAPIPSMMVAQLVPDAADPNLVHGARVKRGSTLRSELPRGQNTLCEFRCAREVQLWPIEIAAVQYFTHAPDLPLAQLPDGQRAKGGLRIRLRALGGASFRDLAIATLPIHIAAADGIAYRLHELALGTCLGTWVRPAKDDAPLPGWRGAESIAALGYDDDEALLPITQRGFSGYRLLQEYAALPQRFLGFTVEDLRARLARVAGTEAEIVLLFGRGDAALESLVDAASLALFCTPAVNLFPKRLDRIVLTPANWEHHAVPDRTRPMDFEVHSIESVTGFGTGIVAEQQFLPMYANLHTEPRSHGAYYTVRREPRVLSAAQKAHGPRSSYVGQEVYLALVDAHQAPYREDLRQIAVSALCTNRDLPNLLPGSGPASNAAEASGWVLDAAGTTARVRCIAGPTRPRARFSDGDIGWSLVSQLSLNYLTIAGDDPARAAAALRSMLALYGPAHDSAWSKQLDGLTGVQARQVVRRLPMGGPLTFGTGIEVTASVDDLAFQGGSAFLLGCLLERFFARHVSLNTFSETVLRTAARGEVMRWPARLGEQALM